MDKVDRLLNDFIAAWNRGERPSADHFVQRAPAGEQDELAGLIGAFLEMAPTPDYSPEQMAELREDPTVKSIAKMVGGRAGLWPALLPKLRNEAKLKRREVVARLAELLGVAEREQKVQRYYHQMETGSIEPQGVSRKVLEALARVLGVSADELEEAGDFSVVPPAVGGAYLRTESVQETRAKLSVEHAAAPASPGGWDEVDELFLGGR